MLIVHANGVGAIRVSDVIEEVGTSLAPVAGEDVVDAVGGEVIAGLHDHHVHLRAAVAAMSSVRVDEGLGPLSAPGSGWIRGIGWDEGTAGDLDRARLDVIAPDRPVRVQHRTGSLWVLNSRALAELGIDSADGRLWRADADLAQRTKSENERSWSEFGQHAAELGITGFTDATPDLTQADLDSLAALARAHLPQRVTLMAPPGRVCPAGVTLGPQKIVLHDDDLPDVHELAARLHIRSAIHCVTVDQLAVAIAALEDAPRLNHRIEHASVVAPAMLDSLRALGVTVVTQPGFVGERGDRYRREVPVDEQAWLYPCASLLIAGIPVAGSSDTPYTDVDPWLAMTAAITRRTRSGAVLNASERVDAATARRLYQGYADEPGRPRRVAAGQPGDLVVLDLDGRPRATIIAGRLLSRCG